jgi:hypothetical protein
LTEELRFDSLERLGPLKRKGISLPAKPALATIPIGLPPLSNDACRGFGSTLEDPTPHPLRTTLGRSAKS